jgi:hypothetical protein
MNIVPNSEDGKFVIIEVFRGGGVLRYKNGKRFADVDLINRFTGKACLKNVLFNLWNNGAEPLIAMILTFDRSKFHQSLVKA